MGGELLHSGYIPINAEPQDCLGVRPGQTHRTKQGKGCVRAES